MPDKNKEKKSSTQAGLDAIEKIHVARGTDNPLETDIDQLKYLNNKFVKGTADNIGAASDWMNKRKYDNRSIIARSRNSVLQFPVYVSQSIPVNAATVIAKMFDRVYASFVQSALAMHPVINEDEANNLLFMKDFHTNITEATKAIINEYYRPIDDIDAMMQESIFYQKEVAPNVVLECAWVPASDMQLIAESKRCVHDPLTGFTYLMEDAKKTVTKKVEDKVLDHDDLSTVAKQYTGKEDSSEAIRQFVDDVKLYDLYINAKNDPEKAAKFRDLEKKDPQAWDRLQDIVDKDNKRDQAILSKYKYVDGRVVYNTSSHTTSVAYDYTKAMDAPALLRDGDIKRINSLTPWTIRAGFHVKSANGTPGYDVNFVIGVKSVMHMIDPKDLGAELRDLIMGNERSLQKVRYKTGELNFMNYMFNIEGLKRDATKRLNKNSRWINTLKRLADLQSKSGGMKMFNTSSANIPNATLILTHQDVTNMANVSGIDISEVANAKRLARSLFLIAIGIIDTTAGTFSVLFPDRDDDWDVQSLASLDAEVSKTDNSKLMNELNRIVNR